MPAAKRKPSSNASKARIDATNSLLRFLSRRGIGLNYPDLCTLLECESILASWSELLCGSSTPTGQDVMIEELDGPDGEPCGKYSKVVRGRDRNGIWTETRTEVGNPVPGTLKRVEKVCKESGLHYYYQDDPRGCALYIGTELLDEHSYVYGAAVCIR